MVTTLEAPQIVTTDGIMVVRDDLLAGGTKARFADSLFASGRPVVYASPAEGGAQTALAFTAQRLGAGLVIFVARRATPHPRTVMAHRLGARVIDVAPGYLSVVQARAREYAQKNGMALAPFGLDIPGAADAIAAAAALLPATLPDEVWCAAGSGVLARGLAKAFPLAARHVVQVGHKLMPSDVGGARIHIYPRPFGSPARTIPPFPSDPHYDAKAWEICAREHGAGSVLFWNVTGPAH